MITVETLCLRIERISPPEIEEWVARRWLRPDGEPGALLFHPIDEARVRLILELRHEMGIDDEALPLVLSLLDQLYAERRRATLLRDALSRESASPLREALARLLQDAPS